ncbi:MAG TPA: 2OG-Fe(II) oxygenase family protein [Sphingomicrobium sp.]|nr:2OG-Fe(II) oxygenase family protein [Sphingomicrobium sp.]
MAERVELLFPTPLIADQLDDASAINAELEKLILEKRANNAGIQRSNVKGWHSDLKLLDWARQPIAPVVQRIVELADRATLDTQAASGQRRGWLLEAWANVSQSGAANAAHTHGGCYWSAVYYVRVDDGEGGELVLHDPRLPALDMHAPALRMRVAEPEQQYSVAPAAGLIVLFPSWLSHSVTPWIGKGLRISVAMNLTAGRKPVSFS